MKELHQLFPFTAYEVRDLRLEDTVVQVFWIALYKMLSQTEVRRLAKGKFRFAFREASQKSCL